MVAHWFKSLERRYGLDLRSLALFRIGLALGVLGHLAGRWALGTQPLPGGLNPAGSIHGLSASMVWQGGWLAIASFTALLLLIGYRTRWATIITGVLLFLPLPPHTLAPSPAGDLLRVLILWAMVLPLGSRYSVDQALNTAPTSPPKHILTGATLGLTAQLSYLYLLSAPAQGNGGWMLASLVLLLLWTPIKTQGCRLGAIALFSLLHLGLAIAVRQSLLLSIVICITWAAMIPTALWDWLTHRAFTPQQRGLKIYYDADCGFCKKVVHLLRTFLVLPDQVPLAIAQSNPIIQTAMETHNSWVIVDWQGQHHYKWQGIAYVVSLSPLWKFLAPGLRWPPFMALGTRLYETIARNRRFAGNFTKPFKFQSFTVHTSKIANLISLLLLLITVVPWQGIIIKGAHGAGVAPHLTPITQMIGLDPSWTIFPNSTP